MGPKREKEAAPGSWIGFCLAICHVIIQSVKQRLHLLIHSEKLEELLQYQELACTRKRIKYLKNWFMLGLYISCIKNAIIM